MSQSFFVDMSDTVRTPRKKVVKATPVPVVQRSKSRLRPVSRISEPSEIIIYKQQQKQENPNEYYTTSKPVEYVIKRSPSKIIDLNPPTKVIHESPRRIIIPPSPPPFAESPTIIQYQQPQQPPKPKYIELETTPNYIEIEPFNNFELTTPRKIMVPTYQHTQNFYDASNYESNAIVKRDVVAKVPYAQPTLPQSKTYLVEEFPATIRRYSAVAPPPPPKQTQPIQYINTHHKRLPTSKIVFLNK